MDSATIDSLAAQCVDDFCAAHAMQAKLMNAAPVPMGAPDLTAGLKSVWSDLAGQVPWMTLLQYTGQILSMLLAGTPYAAIVQAILALLKAPGPVVP